ncbi:hypothetical protein GGR50DRAFT_688533 [Xylaria sp. CBS 124048]|nr:hypothetical protein GGR50DRAFT_688533 [Xylaria sp. CBS 124048]
MDSTGRTDVALSTSATEIADGQPQRRYIPKRPHRKSRAGCRQCKKRKVKCDEARPACKACILRNERCIYQRTAPPPATRSSFVGGRDLAIRSRETSVEEVEIIRDVQFGGSKIPVIAEPLFIPEQAADATDMKMLWFYTTYAFENFSINSGRSPVVDYALKVKIVEHGFRSPFLMEALKASSALQLLALGQPIPSRKITAYQARAFEGYRDAIESGNPADYPALFGCSLFMVVMSSTNFRDLRGKRLFIVDWIPIWRGIGLIVRFISPQAIVDSGLAALFHRPPIQKEAAARYVPQNLWHMVKSIKEDDADYPYRAEYFELLKFLGSLYMELEEYGFNPIFDLRVITFFSLFPRALIPLARELRPRILVIIAHWLCFVKFQHRRGSWWMQGITPQADQIFDELGKEWQHLLLVPKVVMQTEGDVEIARLLTGNPNWTPGELDLYHTHRDPRTKTDLKLRLDDGSEIEILNGEWRVKDSGIKWIAQPNNTSLALLSEPGIAHKDTPRK